MGQKKPQPSVAVRGSAARSAAAEMRRAVVEAVEGRTMMCAIPDAGHAPRALAPWATSPVTLAPATPADGAAVAAPASTAGLPRALSPVSTATLRINSGGGAFTDSLGRVWKADDGFVGGTASAASFAVAGTTDDPLYSSRRYGGFNYNIPVAAAGTYAVKLHFADPLYTTPGKRKFAVRAEGATVLNYFDVAASGGGKAALVRTINVPVSDGTLNLAFVKQMENPILSAIEVVPPSAPSAVGTITSLSLINAGSDAVIGDLANGAVLDQSAGQTYSVRANVAGEVRSVKFLVDGAAFRTESTAPFSIAGDSAGNYAAWGIAPGAHTLSVIPYSGTGGTGTAGAAFNVSFTVNGTNPTPGGNFTTINWATKAAGPIGKAEALTATYNGRLYVFGGFSGPAGPVVRSDYYDYATNTWTQAKDLPQRLTHVGVAQTATDAYFVGGYYGFAGGTGYGQTFGSNKVWKYNFASNTYTAMPNLPRALAAGGAAVVGTKLHYFSGQESSRGDSNVHLVLDLANPAAGWTAAPAALHGRSHFGVGVVGGKIYVIAGQTGNDEGLTTQRWVDVFDPATNSWSARTPIPRAISHVYSGTFVMGDRIIVMGGESGHNSPVRDAYAYTPATDTWVTLTSLPAARFSGVATTIDGKIVFTTGGGQTTTWVGTPG